MSNKFLKNGELQDIAIINALKEATNDYENGAILEARDSLVEIIWAIDDWVVAEMMRR